MLSGKLGELETFSQGSRVGMAGGPGTWELYEHQWIRDPVLEVGSHGHRSLPSRARLL